MLNLAPPSRPCDGLSVPGNDWVAKAWGSLSGRGSFTLNRRPLVRSLLASAAIAAAIALAGCDTDDPPCALRPPHAAALRPHARGDRAPEHGARNRRSWCGSSRRNPSSRSGRRTSTGRFALLKTYPICRWSGELGPKIKEGDRQAPEGFYTITPGLMNPNSQLLSLDQHRLPERLRPRERAHRRVPDDPRRLLVARLLRHDRRADRAKSTRSARESFFGGQKSFQIQAYPFRMTPANMAQAPQLAAHGVLEDAQAGLRPFRGHQAGAEGRRLREALRVRRRIVGASSAPPTAARPTRCRPSMVAAVQGEAAARRRPDRRADQPRHRRPRRSGPAPTAACTRPSWRR